MWRNDFGPEDIRALTDAYDMAVDFVAASPAQMFPELAISRQILALKIVGLAKRGETDRLKLANAALGHLRQASGRRISSVRMAGDLPRREGPTAA